MTAYRADIDGLRALAVLPVMLFHAGVSSFAGGFVGVDVFFVVSGFLITSILVRDIDAGSFSLSRFYERRVRRLFPALFLVVAVSIPVALVILAPEDLENFGQSVIATGTFSSNFLFYFEDGYFEGPADLKPLLHTWSLAIEEQYYLLFPLLLVGLQRRGWGYGKALVSLAVVSFVICLWSAKYAPSAGFYLLPGRFWELMLGAMLALYGHRYRLSALLSAVVAMLGLAMIGYAILRFDDHTPFPGWAALLPCFGTVLVIVAGGQANPLSRVLGSRALAGIGLISYSLYLWHFPLIVFTRHLLVRPFTRWEVVALMVASFVLALLTWRFIERPFRGPHQSVNRSTLIRVACLTVAGAIAFGLFTDFTDGAPARMSPRAQVYLEGLEDRDTACLRKQQGCFIGDEKLNPRYFVWGDSHASAMVPVFRRLSRETGIAGIASLRGGCLPMLGFRVVLVIAESCVRHNQRSLDALLSSDIRTVFLAARWTLFVEQSVYGHESGSAPILLDDPTPVLHASNQEVVRRALQRTLETLRKAGKNVVLIGPVPEVGWHVPHTLAQRARFGGWLDQSALQPTYSEVIARNHTTIELLMELSSAYQSKLLLPHEVFCSRKTGCDVVSDGKVLYYDTDHLTIAGALKLTEMLRPEFTAMLGSL